MMGRDLIPYTAAQNEDEMDDDDDGFFGSDEVGEQEYVEISSSDVFNRPGERRTKYMCKMRRGC